MDRLSVAAAAAKAKEGSSVEFEWTNEKHAAYLHSLEVSFVKSVFGCIADDRSQYYHLNGYDRRHHHPPLDRYVPDSCDSTLDSTTVDLNHAKQYKTELSVTTIPLIACVVGPERLISGKYTDFDARENHMAWKDVDQIFLLPLWVTRTRIIAKGSGPRSRRKVEFLKPKRFRKRIKSSWKASPVQVLGMEVHPD
ncbi:unnamed protein product [Victoria cruziana]